MTTPEDLERLADPAERRQLYPYDDGRFWYLVRNDSLTLCEVANAALSGDLEKFKKCVENGDVEIYKSNKEIEGN